MLQQTSKAKFEAACVWIKEAANYSHQHFDLEGGYTLYIKSSYGKLQAVAEFIEEESLHGSTTPCQYKVHPTILKKVAYTICL